MYFDFAGPRKGGAFFFAGQYSDTNKQFLTQINQPLHFVLGTVFIGSVGSKLLFNFLYIGKRAVLAKSAILQVQMDDIYEGRDF